KSEAQTAVVVTATGLGRIGRKQDRSVVIMATAGSSWASAPPALWAAKRYGRQLRRMSDEFDSWLDAGEMRKAAASARQMPHSRTWWSYLFSYPETEAENNVLHPDNNRNQ
ncbi:hypothetical protein NHX12_013603, partial [Muraenolepis orangiensis]